MTSRIALFVLALALGVTAFTRPSWADDPFGFDALGTPDQYNCDATTLPPPNYACADAPRKHPAFTHYALKFHPSVGMCAVIGVTDVISSDQKFKSTLDDVRHQLEAKYGRLLEHFNRTVTAESSGGIHGSNIIKILLWPDFDHNTIRLTFEFIDSQRCEAAARADQKGAF